MVEYSVKVVLVL